MLQDILDWLSWTINDSRTFSILRLIEEFPLSNISRLYVVGLSRFLLLKLIIVIVVWLSLLVAQWSHLCWLCWERGSLGSVQCPASPLLLFVWSGSYVPFDVSQGAFLGFALAAGKFLICIKGCKWKYSYCLFCF